MIDTALWLSYIGGVLVAFPINSRWLRFTAIVVGCVLYGTGTYVSRLDEWPWEATTPPPPPSFPSGTKI